MNSFATRPFNVRGPATTDDLVRHERMLSIAFELSMALRQAGVKADVLWKMSDPDKRPWLGQFVVQNFD